MNISDILEQQAQQLASAPCIFLDDGCWSYQTLNQSVWRVAADLHRAGVRRGEVLAHTFVSELAQLVAVLASARIGATVFSVPRSTPIPLRDDMLKTVGVAWLLTDLQNLQVSALKSIHVRVNAETDSGDEQHALSTIRDADPSAPWIIVSGSGTTGKRKLMAVTHRQQWARMQAGLHWLPYTQQDVLACLVHLDFYASKQRCLEAFMKGASISLSASRHLTYEEGRGQSQATVIYGTVFHVERMLKSLPGDGKVFAASFHTLMIGGSTVTMSLRKRVCDRLTTKLYVLYGANECHTTCRTDLSGVFSVTGNVGRPHPGFSLEIVDANDVQLPPMYVGHVRIRSQAMIDGYLNDAQATARAFKQGWFYPGDLGKLTPDGQLIHLGRADDMMIMNGINIYPVEIEQVMTSHPSVLDAAAISIKHEVHQDIPVCVVTLSPNEQLHGQALMAYARERLGAHSPHRIIILRAIPRNEQGKLIRAELLPLIVAELSQPPMEVTTIRTNRQLALRMSISFQLPPKPDLRQLDIWLTQVLTNDLANWPEPDFPGRAQVPDLTLRWLWHCLLLARLLLQAARVPVFDPPQVLSCAGDGQANGLWKACIALPSVDDQISDLYLESLRTSFRLAEWAALRPITQDNLNRFYRTISQRVLVTAAKSLPFGNSTYTVLNVAYVKAIPFRHLGGGVFQLGWGANARRLDRSATEFDSAIGARLSHSKVLTARLLRAAGLPVAVLDVVNDPKAAVNAAQRLGWPVVVKPVDGEHGEGATIIAADEDVLKSAFDRAMGHSRSRAVIIERQVSGVCHRLFMVNGKLLYAVKRGPMSVVGDGQHTVAELIALEYGLQQQEPPWKRSEVKPLDALAEAAMATAGFSKNSVPASGVLVPLRSSESTESGGVDEEVTNCVHPENLRIAQAAMALVGLHVAGVDIITTDISQPWQESGAIIDDVSFVPLLGGTDISRSYIPKFLDDLVQGRGLIPVDVFVGGERAWQSALQRQQTLVSTGVAAYLTREFQTLAPTGEQVPMPLTGLYHRAQALLLSSRVGVMVLCVQTDELLDSGLPLEWIDEFTLIDLQLVTFGQPEQVVPADRIVALQQLLGRWKPIL